MSVGDHTPNPTLQERRKVRYGTARQKVIAAAAAVAALIGILAFAS